MPTVGDIYKLALEFETIDAGKMMNIFDVEVDAGACSDLQLLAGLATWVNVAYGALVTCVHNTVSCQTSQVSKMLWTGTAWIVDRLVGIILPTVNFTNANEALPHATSALVQFLTTKPRVVGKKYLPVFGENGQNGSFIDGGFLPHMLNYATIIRTPITADAATLNYKILTKTGGREVPYGHVANGVISSQHKRKPGLGV